MWSISHVLYGLLVFSSFPFLIMYLDVHFNFNFNFLIYFEELIYRCVWKHIRVSILAKAPDSSSMDAFPVYNSLVHESARCSSGLRDITFVIS